MAFDLETLALLKIFADLVRPGRELETCGPLAALGLFYIFAIAPSALAASLVLYIFLLATCDLAACAFLYIFMRAARGPGAELQANRA